MTYKLRTDAKGYKTRLKKLLDMERKAGSTITSFEYQGNRLAIITVENKGGIAHADIRMPEVRVQMDTQDRQPESVPVVQAIPEKRPAEKSKPEKIKTLNMTLPPELFEAVLSGEKRMICTRHNTRKDRYFRENAPGFAKIKNAGRLIRCPIVMTTVTAEEIQVIIGDIIETAGCPCKHPPSRLYSWSGEDAKGPFTNVVCCRCGDVLKGSV